MPLAPDTPSERKLRRAITEHLRGLGFRIERGTVAPPSTNGKASLRALHQSQRAERLAAEDSFIRTHLGALLPLFAEGKDVQPDRIRPSLTLVRSDTPEADLFRLASLTWSVPVSRGYGRRMRFIVRDESNGKLIGIFALGDPVFNLKARDGLIGWNADDRRLRLVNVMDAYVMGALPPYSLILGGKLMACLARTKEVRDLFAQRYRAAEGIISRSAKHASLAMITTSSALGRSSLYNRLTLGDTRYMESIGFTAGWGHFQIPDGLFREMRQYLSSAGHDYAANHRFGDGPNWRLRTVRATLTMLGLDPDLLRHGIGREVFVCRVARNAEGFLKGEAARPDYGNLLNVREVAEMALERWVLPRAIRRPEYQDWRHEQLLALLGPR